MEFCLALCFHVSFFSGICPKKRGNFNYSEVWLWKGKKLVVWLFSSIVNYIEKRLGDDNASTKQLRYGEIMRCNTRLVGLFATHVCTVVKLHHFSSGSRIGVPIKKKHATKKMNERYHLYKTFFLIQPFGVKPIIWTIYSIVTICFHIVNMVVQPRKTNHSTWKTRGRGKLFPFRALGLLVGASC